ncbi:MAG TPA: Crp/Fnr family transcriptional regulator [Candidatus Eisenbacteria bacterium]|nr:Crp/Fnr family transcriptional regulator [Candidatus Eisenbacteria bacterium]
MAHSIAGDRAADRKRDTLAKMPFYKLAPPELQREIAASASVVRLESGAYFLREGDTCEHFAVLVSGRMRVFKLGERGHEITLYHVGAGEACPLNVSCILSDREVPAMARVEEDVEAIVIPAATFRAWMAQHESLRTFVFMTFATRLSEMMSLVEEVAFRRMDQRLARRLHDILQTARAEGAKTASVEITHAELASDLGTAREVVSRLLKELERLGAISLSRGRIALRNGARLREMAALPEDD